MLNNYAQVKAESPETPFIVRECTNAQPAVMARYDFGVERRVYVHGLEEQEVAQAVQELVAQAAEINAALPRHA